MKKKSKQLLNVLIRYIILVLIALPNLWLFYEIFTPLTQYPVYFLLNLFYDASLGHKIIDLGHITIEIIPACVAGSAYYLLTILTLSLQKIKLKKRIKLLLSVFLSFLILNILRVFVLSIMAVSDSPSFDITHKLFWYIGSIIFVIFIWFIGISILKVKEIPFFNDIKFLYKQIKIKK